MVRYVVARTADIPPGVNKVFNLRGREIAVFNVKGKYFSVLNKCPHKGARLCFGVMVGLVGSKGPGDFDYSREGEILRCPWHGWEFDIATGEAFAGPNGMVTKNYSTSVEAGVEIDESFRLDVFEVKIEEDYIVVDV